MQQKYKTITDINNLMGKIGCFNKTQLDTRMHESYINESLETEDWHSVRHDKNDIKQGLKSKDHNEQIIVTPSYSILYNCSKSKDIPSIIEKGPNWEYCNAHAFGKGVYTNFQEWQAHESAFGKRRSVYGDTIVKYRYNGDLMKECLVLEPQLWKLSGNLKQQAERFKGFEEFLKKNGSSLEALEARTKGEPFSSKTSHLVMGAVDNEYPRSKGDNIYHKTGNHHGPHADDVLMRFGIQGLIHYGPYDGPVAVIYNSHKLQALEYYTVEDPYRHQKEGHNLEWVKIPEGKGINVQLNDTRAFTHFLSDRFEGNPLHLRPRCGELLMKDKQTNKWAFIDVAKAENVIYKGGNEDVRLFGDFEFCDALNFDVYGNRELAYVQLDNDKTSRFYIDKNGNLYQNEQAPHPISNIKSYYADENEPMNNDTDEDKFDIDGEISDDDLKSFENMFGFGMLESIKTITRKSLNEEIVRPLVNNMMSILSIIDRTWKSPDDLYYIKIDQRFKDFRNFNVDKGFNTHDRGAKRWKQEDLSGKDSTKRENHVGYCIVRGLTKEGCKENALNVTVHLNPWAAKMYGKDTLHSNGGMEAIIEVCHRFFARAYMVINPRSMQRTIDRAREDKKIGRFRGREFNHRAGQSKSGFDGTTDWNKVYPDALIDCDISDPNAWKDVEKLLKANGCQIYNKMKSHQGIHFIVNYNECKNIDFTPIMRAYPSFNKPGDPAILLKHDANTMVYSPAGVRE